MDSILLNLLPVFQGGLGKKKKSQAQLLAIFMIFLIPAAVMAYDIAVNNTSITGELTGIGVLNLSGNMTGNESINLTPNSTNSTAIQKTLPSMNVESRIRSITMLGKEAMESVLKNEKTRLIVKFRGEKSFETKDTRKEDFDLKAEGRKFLSAEVSKEGLLELAENPDIESIHIDRPVSMLTSGSMELINADDVHGLGLNGSGTKVCFLDTGINYMYIHSFSQGHDFVNDDNDPWDDQGHGTEVASILDSVAPGIDLVVAKVIDRDGKGYESDVLEGLEYCEQEGADVISLSIGSGSYDGYCDSNPVAEYCNQLVDNGTLVIAATGNDGSRKIKSPACGSGVISVAASTKDDEIASFSSVNHWTDLLAPGEDIRVRTMGGEYSKRSGTSMSVPFVSGVSALLLENEPLLPGEVEHMLKTTGKPVPYQVNSTYTTNISRIDAWNAVNNITTMQPVEEGTNQSQDEGGDEYDILSVSINDVTIKPDTANPNDNLRGYCNATGDEDAEIRKFEYKWYNDSVEWVNGTAFKKGSISAGDEHSCGIRANDSRVLCWGLGNQGRLGDGDTNAHEAGSPNVTMDTSAYLSVSAGGVHTCGVRANDSRVLCWGLGNEGQLGDGDTNAHSVGHPNLTTDESAYLSISTGDAHTCGIRANDSRVLCWGYGYGGRLGDGNVDIHDVGSPNLTMDDSAYLSVSAGGVHTCGVRANDSRVLCCGRGNNGQIGDGRTDQHNVPYFTLTTDDSAYISVSNGFQHTCGIRANDSRVLCWGFGDHGQLGDGVVGDHSVGNPNVTTDDSEYLGVSAGNYHTCGIRANDSRVLCWGNGTYGRLGDGNTSIHGAGDPNVTTDSSEYTSVAAGYYHTCGIRESDGRVLCWGHGGDGQIGDGDTGNHNVSDPSVTTDSSEYSSFWTNDQSNFLDMVDSSYITSWQSWKFSCRAYNGTEWSSWVNSTETDIETKINISEELSENETFSGKNISVYGQVVNSSTGSPIENENISLYLNDTFYGSDMSNATGYYNISFLAPNISSGDYGIYTVTVNDDEVSGKNSTNLLVYPGILISETLEPNETTVQHEYVSAWGHINLTNGTDLANHAFNMYMNGTLINGMVDIYSIGDSHPEGWWDYNWAYRENLSINNTGGQGIDQFPVYADIDTETLVSQGKLNASCSDLRIFQDGEELEWSNQTACNDSSTRIWFKANLSEDSIFNVTMYYGNPLSGDPDYGEVCMKYEGDTCYVFYDDFSDNDCDGWKCIKDDYASDWGEGEDCTSNLDCSEGNMSLGGSNQNYKWVVSNFTENYNYVNITAELKYYDFYEVGPCVYKDNTTFLASTAQYWSGNYNRIRLYNYLSIASNETFNSDTFVWHNMTMLRNDTYAESYTDIDEAKVSNDSVSLPGGPYNASLWGESASDSLMDNYRISLFGAEPDVTETGNEDYVFETDADGDYNITFQAPSELGTYPILVNTTYTVEGHTTSEETVKDLEIVGVSFSGHKIDPDPPNIVQDVQINVTMTSDYGVNWTALEFHNGTHVMNYTGAQNASDEYYITIGQGNYTQSHQNMSYYWYANNSLGQTSHSSLQEFILKNYVPQYKDVSGDDNKGWGETWDFYINVSDQDQADNITVSVQENRTGSWSTMNSTTCWGCSGWNYLNVKSSWSRYAVGNQYWRLLIDDEYETNITPAYPVTVEKDDTGVSLTEGDGGEVNRSGSQKMTLTAFVNDTDRGFPVPDITCHFWITKDGSNYIHEGTNTTNSTGHCTLDFEPDNNYSTGVQNWKAGISGGAYYKDSNSSEGSLNIIGELNASLQEPSGQTYRAGSDSVLFRWNVTDDNSSMVSGVSNTIEVLPGGGSWEEITGSCSVNDEGGGWYNCTWDVPHDQTYGTYDVRVNTSKTYYNDGSDSFGGRFSVNTTDPVLSGPSSATEQDGGWGEWWNYSVDLNEVNPDTVNVSLWYDRGGGWELVNSMDVSCPCTDERVSFLHDPGWNIDDVGSRSYKFNASDYEGGKDDTGSQGADVRKDNVSIEYVAGNESEVNRSGTNSTDLKVRVFDTDRDAFLGSDVNVSLWVTTDGAGYNPDSSGVTDPEGYANFSFDPSGIYSVGRQEWIIGTEGDEYYDDENSSVYNVTVFGDLFGMVEYEEDHNVTDIVTLRGNVTDDEGEMVSGLGATFEVSLDGMSWEECTPVDDEGDGWYNCSWDSTGKDEGDWDVRMNYSGTYYNNGSVSEGDWFFLDNLEPYNSSPLLVDPPVDGWGYNFTYNTTVSDPENDSVTCTLWSNAGGGWVLKGRMTAQAPYICSLHADDYEWDYQGDYLFKFRLNDTFNEVNTTTENGTLEKDDIELEVTDCSNCHAPRDQYTLTLISYNITDLDRGGLITHQIECRLNVTRDFSNYDSFSNTTSPGYCRRYFNPGCNSTDGDGEYFLGQQDFMGEIPENSYYKTATITSQNVNIWGQIYHQIQIPDGEDYTEGENVPIRGRATDDCGNTIQTLDGKVFYYLENEADNVTQCTPVTNDGGGWYNCTWNSSGGKMGNYNITMNSTDHNLRYGGEYKKVDAFFLQTNDTSADLLIIPEENIVDGINRSSNRTFEIQVTLNNTGFSKLYNASINNHTMPENWTISPSIHDCGDILPGENCTENFTITVINGTTEGIYYVNLTGNWTQGNLVNKSAANQTMVNVTPNYKLEISESVVYGNASSGTTTTIGNFTLVAFGSGNLSDVEIECLSGACLNMPPDPVVYFFPDPVSSLPGGNTMKININATSQSDDKEEEGIVYILRANATGTACSPANECWETVTLNLSIVNDPPVLSNAQVTEQVDGWGAEYNYSVQVFDNNDDDINITLWVNPGGTWMRNETKVVSSGTMVNWTISPFSFSDTEETRNYLFEYNDLNSTGDKKHNLTNTTTFSGPYVQKDNVSIEYVAGNESEVNRSGTNSTDLKVRVFDTDRDAFLGSDVNVSLWVTTDGAGYNPDSSGVTDPEGYANFSFDPSGIYSVGRQEWIIGTEGDEYYDDENSSVYNVTVFGDLFGMVEYEEDHNVTDIVTLRGNVTDDEGEMVSGLGATFEVSLDGMSWEECTPVDDEGDGWYNCSWDSTGKDEGDWDVRMNYSGTYYNNGSVSEGDWFFLDNLEPGWSSLSVDPYQEGWGSTFTYNVSITDPENDNVTCELWSNASGIWVMKNSTTQQAPYTCSMEAKDYNGTDLYAGDDNETYNYRFRVNDSFNQMNTSEGTGKLEKDNITLVVTACDDCEAPRDGTKKTLIEYSINDTDRGTLAIYDIACYINVTLTGGGSPDSFSNTSSEGYCRRYFNPDCSYYVGHQDWYGKVSESKYYDYAEITSQLDVVGQFRHKIETPDGENYLEGENITIRGNTTDDCDNTVDGLGNVEFHLINENGINVSQCTPVNDEGSGWYNCTWDSWNQETGKYNITMNTTNLPSPPSTPVYYNGTYNKKDALVLEATQTFADLLLIPIYKETDNVTKYLNQTFNLTAVLNNTGEAYLYNATINRSYFPGWWNVTPVSHNCGMVETGNNCTRNFTVLVVNGTTSGIYYVGFKANWTNMIGTENSAVNETEVNVTENYDLEIREDEIAGGAFIGRTTTIGNFTIDADCSAELSDIRFTNKSGFCANPLDERKITLIPKNVSNLTGGTHIVIDINVTVPLGYPETTGPCTIQANATNSTCSPAGECWDELIINVTTVNEPPQLSDANVSNSTDGWGAEYNYSVFVYDHNGDDVNVTLWINNSGTWEKNETKLVGAGSTPYWTIRPFNSSDIGETMGFMFEYKDDYNNASNTSEFTGPSIERDDLLIEITGNSSTTLSRNAGEKALIEVMVTDSDRGIPLEGGRNCTFWSTRDGISYTTESENTTDSGGYCRYYLDSINCTYSVYYQYWEAGLGDSLYKEYNSSQGNFTVAGWITHNITRPAGDYHYESQSILFRGNATDECSDPATPADVSFFPESNGSEFSCSPANDEGNGWYNCSWDSTGMPAGWYDLKMNTTDSEYYNGNGTSTSNAFYLQNQTISPAFTTMPSHYWTNNVTANYSTTFNISLNLTNTGQGFLYSSSVNHTYFPPGWEIVPGLQGCGDVWAGENCTRSYSVTIPNGTQPANYTINFTAYWTNPDSSPGSATNSTHITVASPTMINITSPTSSDKAVDVLPGDRVQITANVTHRLSPVSDGVDFDIRLDEEDCALESSSYIGPFKLWYLECTAPNLTDAEYHNLTINTTNSFDGTVANDTETDAVYYKDTTPPYNVNVTSESVTEGGTVEVLAYLTDKEYVSNVSMNLTHPNGSVSVRWLQNQTPETNSTYWAVNLSGLSIGDHDYVLYARDKNGNLRNITWWFAVYPSDMVTINGTILDMEGQPVLSDFFMYRDNRSLSPDYLLNSFSTNSSGNYSRDVYRRVYDIEWKINSSMDAVGMFGINVTENMTDPVGFDDIALKYISIPLTRVILKAFAVNSTMNFSRANISMNFTGTGYEHNFIDVIRVYQCRDWDWTENGCNSTWINRGGSVDVDTETVTATVDNFSAFVAAEEVVCGNEICENVYGESSDNCPEDCWAPGPGDEEETPGGGYTGGVSAGAVCGNDRCETGENYQNCPEDCPKEEEPYAIDTDVIDIELLPGESRLYPITIENRQEDASDVDMEVTGTIWEFTQLQSRSFSIDEQSAKTVKVKFFAPMSAPPGVYNGELLVTVDDTPNTIPVTLRIVTEKEALMDVKVEVLTKILGQNGTVRYRLSLFNLGYKKKFDVHLTHNIRDVNTNKLLAYKEEEMALETTLSMVKNFPLDEINIYPGKFYIEVVASYENKTASSADIFEVVEPFWTMDKIYMLIAAIAIAVALIVGWKGSRWYSKWKLRRRRYLFPVDYKKLPKGPIYMGKIAETGTKAWLDPDDLTTHILSAGATGAGKSVSAMVTVEECLKLKIPVVVFDPTGQWTGFVKRCTDRKMLDRYDEFGMKETDAMPFKGMIFEVTDPKVKIKFKEFMNPSEITVFMLNKLKPGEFDQAVQNIVQTIFETDWEESPKLRLLVIFDEVHRLLEKYGGSGGYVALERGCREFRKWGIGMIMLSQVLADFKEAIKGNVLTEFQLHTKGLGDIDRVKKKYGEEYSNRITKQEVGVGMVQNPKYNRGRPYFVAFRPLLHSPHKIPEEELEKYKKFAKELKEMEREIRSLEKKKVDTTDIKLELKLAKDKLKTGAFRMTEIYLDSLRGSLKKHSRKKGKKKKKRGKKK